MWLLLAGVLSSFTPRSAFLSRNPHELVLFLTDLENACVWVKKPDLAPPHTHLLVLFSDQRGEKLAEPRGPQDVTVLTVLQYIDSRNRKSRRQQVTPGVYAGVLTHLA